MSETTGTTTTWRLMVRHSTGYRYASAVRASYNEARMTPVTDLGQLTLESRLDVSPSVRPLRYWDYWGTVVDAFDVHVPHTELSVTATSVVETGPARPVAEPAGWEVLSSPAVRDRYAEMLAGSRYVVPEPDLGEVAAQLRAGASPAQAGRRAVAWAHDQLVYERGPTGVHTTSAEARATGKGVCQDLAHVALATLRAVGLPARYVSGYLHPSPEAPLGEVSSGESHAWVEYWVGGWVAADPTLLSDVGERHVVVARGRDYADVRPLSGVYHGPPARSLGVRVEITRLR